jgi:hypothetical protein
VGVCVRAYILALACCRLLLLLLLSWWCCRAAEMTSGPKFEWIRIALLPMCRKGQMGQKMVRFAALSGTRSRQDEPIEVGEVGSKRPSLGGNGGHFAWWGGLIALRLVGGGARKRAGISKAGRAAPRGTDRALNTSSALYALSFYLLPTPAAARRSQHPLDPPHPTGMTGVGLWASGFRPIPATSRTPFPVRASVWPGQVRGSESSR